MSPRWTPAELRTLHTHWRMVDDRQLKRLLRRRSWRAIFAKAVELGLPRALPPGHESIASAIRRTGHRRRPLLRILRRHGVPLHTRGIARRQQSTYVSQARVDCAVANERRLESAEQAARRLQIDRATLTILLCEQGHRVPRGRSVLRLPSEVFDELVGAYRAGHKNNALRAYKSRVLRRRVCEWCGRNTPQYRRLPDGGYECQRERQCIARKQPFRKIGIEELLQRVIANRWNLAKTAKEAKARNSSLIRYLERHVPEQIERAREAGLVRSRRRRAA